MDRDLNEKTVSGW